MEALENRLNRIRCNRTRIKLKHEGDVWISQELNYDCHNEKILFFLYLSFWQNKLFTIKLRNVAYNLVFFKPPTNDKQNFLISLIISLEVEYKCKYSLRRIELQIENQVASDCGQGTTNQGMSNSWFIGSLSWRRRKIPEKQSSWMEGRGLFLEFWKNFFIVVPWEILEKDTREDKELLSRVPQKIAEASQSSWVWWEKREIAKAAEDLVPCIGTGEKTKWKEF